MLVSGDLVDEGFDREGVLYASRRSKINRPKQLLGEMGRRPHVGELIGRRIRTSRKPIPIRIPTGETPGVGVAGLTSRMTLRPLLKVERDDTTLCIQAGLNVHGHCGAHWLPAVFIVAHPLHTHWSSDLLRQQRRISGGVVAAQSAVRAGSFHPDKADAVER